MVFKLTADFVAVAENDDQVVCWESKYMKLETATNVAVLQGL